MRAFITIIISFYSLTLFSQNSFELNISTAERELLHTSFELENGDFILGGKRGDYGYLLKINAMGDIIKEKEIAFHDGRLAVQKVLPVNDNQFLAISSAGDLKIPNTNKYFYNTIIVNRYDTDFNLIFSKKYKTLEDSVRIFNIMTLLKENGNIVLTSGVDRDFGSIIDEDVDMFFMEINEKGDLIKSKFNFNDTKNYDHIFGLIEKKNNSGYYCLSRSRRNQAVPVFGIVYNLDNNFDTIAKMKIPHNVFNTGGIKWLTDTTYIVTGRFIGHYPNPYDDLGALVLDTLNNEVSFNHFHKNRDMKEAPAISNSIEYIPEDEYIYIGGTSNYYYNGTRETSTNNYIHFIKTDKELNPICEKFYKGDAYYVTDFFSRTNDGGFIFLASRFNYREPLNGLDIYILKTDAEGNVLSSNENLDIKPTEVLLYPNPATDKLNIKVAVQKIGGVLYIYDISGKIVLQQQITDSNTSINIENLTRGTYIYKFYYGNQLSESGKWIKK